MVATLTGAATVVVIALVARELGGSRSTQATAAAMTSGSSLVLVVSHMLATNTANTSLWALFAPKLLRAGDPAAGSRWCRGGRGASPTRG